MSSGGPWCHVPGAAWKSNTSALVIFGCCDRTLEWLIYYEQNLLAHSSAGWKVQYQGIASSCCIINWWKAKPKHLLKVLLPNTITMRIQVQHEHPTTGCEYPRDGRLSKGGPWKSFWGQNLDKPKLPVLHCDVWRLLWDSSCPLCMGAHKMFLTCSGPSVVRGPAASACLGVCSVSAPAHSCWVRYCILIHPHWLCVYHSLWNIALGRGREHFSVRCQTVNILDSVDHVISIIMGLTQMDLAVFQ
jgi:hypothetical protein